MYVDKDGKVKSEDIEKIDMEINESRDFSSYSGIDVSKVSEDELYSEGVTLPGDGWTSSSGTSSNESSGGGGGYSPQTSSIVGKGDVSAGTSKNIGRELLNDTVDEGCEPEWQCIIGSDCLGSGYKTKLCRDIKCGSESITEKIKCKGGCEYRESLYPIGIREIIDGEDVYCDISEIFKKQKEKGDSCSEDYECLTNYCSDGICMDLEEEVGWIKNVLEGLKNLF
jgi:hypothetical protein